MAGDDWQQVRDRILIAFLLGAWLAGTLFMWSVATQNFRLVDRLLASPAGELRERTAPLASGDTRLVMRYQASEVNRVLFDRWGWTQLGLAGALVWLVFRSPADRWVQMAVLVMALIAAVLQFAVVPETVRLGRLLDFAAREPAPPEAAPFWRLHTAYTALDMLKFILGVAVTAGLWRGRVE